MSLLRRRTLFRRLFAALERVASNVGLVREAGKEFRFFSHEVRVRRALMLAEEALLRVLSLRPPTRRHPPPALLRRQGPGKTSPLLLPILSAHPRPCFHRK
jgi:hypothetical protein